MEKITNLIRISTNSKLDMSPEGDFFKTWVEFLKPVHKLTNKEMSVLAIFLKKRYELSKVIIDQDTLDNVLMSEEVKREIRLKCGISSKYFQIVMSKFRKNGVIQNNRIYPRLIPEMTDEGVGLMIQFNFRNEQLIKLGPQAGKQEAMH